MKKIYKVGIIGARSYTGGELLRLLINHSNVDVVSITTSSVDEQVITNIHQDLIGQTKLRLTKALRGDEDVIFICSGHGKSLSLLSSELKGFQGKIIDLNNDFRLFQDAKTPLGTFVYGMPELNKQDIQKSNLIANPGCFATAIELAVFPLASVALLHSEIHISATTGSTGAGAILTPTSHFSWRNNNFSIYKTFKHQHLKEIFQSISKLQKGFNQKTYFLPFRGNFTRGIFSTSYTKYDGTLEDAYELFTSYYQNSFFVQISKQPISLKQVVNTNFCLMNLELIDGMLIIHSAIDNLIKGASGQAIQNMNLILGLEETEGLKLKASYF